MLRSDEITRYTITARFTTQRSTLRAIALFCTMNVCGFDDGDSHSARSPGRQEQRAWPWRAWPARRAWHRRAWHRRAWHRRAWPRRAGGRAAAVRICQRRAWGSVGAVRQQQCAEGDVQGCSSASPLGCALGGGDVAGVSRMRAAMRRCRARAKLTAPCTLNMLAAAEQPRARAAPHHQQASTQARFFAPHYVETPCRDNP